MNITNLARLGMLLLPLIAAIAPFSVSAEERIVHYQCEGDQSFQVTFYRNKDNIDRAWITFPNQPRSAKLRPLDANEGVKYGNDKMVLRMLDKSAILEMNYEPFLNNCTIQ